MVKYKIRGNTIYIEYYVDKIRYRRSTNLKDTPENVDYVKNTLLPELEKKISNGSIYKSKDISFRKYGNIFLDIKEKTIRSYTQKMGYFLRVINYFGDYNVDEITRLDVKQFYNSLNMKAKSKGMYRSAIIEIFELAIDDGAISFNPAIGINLGKDEPVEIDYYSKAQVQKLLINAEGLIKLYLEIAFNHGLRPEEILGLQFTDIKNKKMSIKRVRTLGRVDYPKTKNSYRTLIISDNLNDLINQYKETSTSLYLMGDDKDKSSKFRYEWKTLIKKANVPYKKLSCARHTFATHMLRDNVVSINELSGLLGHSKPRITLQHYASVIDSKEVDLGKNFSLYSVDTDNGTVAQA